MHNLCEWGEGEVVDGSLGDWEKGREGYTVGWNVHSLSAGGELSSPYKSYSSGFSPTHNWCLWKGDGVVGFDVRRGRGAKTGGQKGRDTY